LQTALKKLGYKQDRKVRMS